MTGVDPRPSEEPVTPVSCHPHLRPQRIIADLTYLHWIKIRRSNEVQR